MYMYVGQYVVQHKWENRLKKKLTLSLFLNFTPPSGFYNNFSITDYLHVRGWEISPQHIFAPLQISNIVVFFKSEKASLSQVTVNVHL